ncbi:PIG-L family deacetylase [Jannaschia seohaensis]|uniref:LmbE family N-acetylglucosaminyl deacetylase n=1 Tax=Jannaschia seohaensis TaxID=475081 RepID=A0A2Y9B7C8_9RHOB|nr:PIG-L family deacetylase [Jannaschia seohaensis]PWJ11445.1 LmbE family N-acetylglucosaminyl deacetylase [Jannaschia seohaensis]SSA51418.1 N-acetylglucosaminyl deacetylase, LmbE family [Jannaschia seohaensis]
MTPDQTRLEADRAAPRIVQLWRLVTGMRTPLTFMQSGAHPDDETSGMLAALRFRDGLDLAYVCSTRGEGGQNDIGREAGAALGVLRTAEMERAAEILDMRVRWMTPAPGDPVHDFGFSKSGEEALARWGRDRTLDRFARALRVLRPDLLCPTFLDVPGQHGHHRAMTLLAPEAIARAADPAWETEQEPWRVTKLYLPAWSGAGTAYDDDLPPPPATVVVSGQGVDPVTGASWARIGQWSRGMHRTQGMGRWPEAQRDWPLHLVEGGAEEAVTEGLPVCWADLGWPGGARIDALVAEMVAALARPDVVARAGSEALALVPERGHRAERLRTRLHRALFLAAGAEARGWAEAPLVRPGAHVPIRLETRAGALEAVSATVALPEGWTTGEAGVTVSPSVDATAYPDGYDPLDPAAPCLAVEGTWRGTPLSLRLPLDRTPAARPDGVALKPEAEVVNLARETSVAVRCDGDLDLPEGWRREGAVLHLPPRVGLHEIAVLRDGAPARLVTEIAAPHIPTRVLARPAILRLRALEVAVPDARVAVFGAGRDRVAHWLRRIGVDVSEPHVEALDDPQADTVLLGVFALRFRDGLAERMPRLSDWVRGGGTLTTLYHRPWDAWDPDAMPAPIEIGQPSLRWRVTDNAAKVTHLADHPILAAPNPISDADWEGWHKERGLYFARSWDAAYTPLLEMADPGEAPLRGALLSGQVGQGRHTHCALILHHQMEHLVPGAFRLMANLVAPI